MVISVKMVLILGRFYARRVKLSRRGRYYYSGGRLYLSRAAIKRTVLDDEGACGHYIEDGFITVGQL